VLTLQGGYVDDGDGHEWGPGDMQTMDPGTSHSFVGAAGPDCICLGVVLGPIEIDGTIPVVPPA
jgi:anti-sigma factor ChrR (cupin superfamily)